MFRFSFCYCPRVRDSYYPGTICQGDPSWTALFECILPTLFEFLRAGDDLALVSMV
jgi:hypothetical protein